MFELAERFDVNDALKRGVTREQLLEGAVAYQQAGLKTVPSSGFASDSRSEQATAGTNQSAGIVSSPTSNLLADDAWHPVLAEMRDALHLRLPSPDSLLMAGLLAVPSHIIGRRAVTDLGGQHYLNLYSLMVAGTDVGKSAVMDYLRSELIQAINGGGKLTFGPIVVAGIFASPEGMDADFRHLGSNHLLQIVDEWSHQLGKSKSDGAGPIIQAITSLWTGSGTTSTTKQARIDLSNKHLSILAGSTWEWLAENLDKSSVGGGFVNRFCYFIGEKEQARDLARIHPPDPNVVSKFVGTLAAIDQSLGTHGGAQSPKTITADKAAMIRWVDYRKEFKDRRAQLCETDQQVIERVDRFTAKIAAIYALLSGATSIGIDDMGRAILVGDYLWQSALDLFSDFAASPKLRVAKKIRAKLIKAGGRMRKSQLYDNLSDKDREVSGYAIAWLRRMGLLEEERVGKQRFWVLADKDAEHQS
jgi:hypothetical protein